jgi:hypothetical protein
MKIFEAVYIFDHNPISCYRHRRGTLALQLVKEIHHYNEENEATRFWSMNQRGSPHCGTLLSREVSYPLCVLCVLCCFSINFFT